MITIKNARSPKGKVANFTIESAFSEVIDAQGRLMVLPALIDPHVHFRVPGAEHKEDWRSAAQAAVAGGVTTVIDMPNNRPSCISSERLGAKQQLIDAQLAEVDIPLRYHLYLGADQNHLQEMGKVKNRAIGLKIYMGSSTGDLLMSDEHSLAKAFEIAAKEGMLVSVHAEDESLIQKNHTKYASTASPEIHSKIRSREAAARAVEQAIGLSRKFGTRLFILHLSTKEELELVRNAKAEGLPVYAEATPHHLFLSEKDYPKWGVRVQMNPPLRTEQDQEALWSGIRDGTIDVIGTDHAPHTKEEKQLPYGKAPSGVPGIETLLPLLLNAFHENKITLEQIIALTRRNSEKIFGLTPHDDVVLVDLEQEKEVRDEALHTKCGWSPYSGKILKGWPVYTILKGRIFHA